MRPFGNIPVLGDAARSIWMAIEGIWINCNELALHIRTKQEDRHAFSRRGAEQSLETAESHPRPMHADSIIYLPPDYWCVYKVARMLELKS